MKKFVAMPIKRDSNSVVESFMRTLSLLSFFFFLLIQCSHDTVEITISVEAEVPPNEQVHIAGNLHRVEEWESRHQPLQQQEDGTWEITLPLERGHELQFKLTRGDWRTEAVDSSGLELDNYRITATRDTTLYLTVDQWRDQVRVPTQLSQARLKNKGGQVELWENWKFHAGDDSTWADPGLDDSDWKFVNTQLPEERLPTTWQGIGWFRLS